MDRVAIIIFKDEKYAYIRLSPKMLHKRRPVCNKRVTHSECFTIQTHPFEQLMHIPTPPQQAAAGYGRRGGRRCVPNPEQLSPQHSTGGMDLTMESDVIQGSEQGWPSADDGEPRRRCFRSRAHHYSPLQNGFEERGDLFLPLGTYGTQNSFTGCVIYWSGFFSMQKHCRPPILHMGSLLHWLLETT